MQNQCDADIFDGAPTAGHRGRQTRAKTQLVNSVMRWKNVINIHKEALSSNSHCRHHSYAS
jgi:hypothetical protein